MPPHEQEERDFVHTPLIQVAEDHARRGYVEALAGEDILIRDALIKGLVVVTSDFIVSTELDTYVNIGRAFEGAFYLRADAEAFIAKQDQLHEEYLGDVLPGYHILMPEEK